MIIHNGKVYSGISKKDPIFGHEHVWEVGYYHRGEYCWHGRHYDSVENAILVWEHWHPLDVARIDEKKAKEEPDPYGMDSYRHSQVEREGITLTKDGHMVEVEKNGNIVVVGSYLTRGEAERVFEKEKEFEKVRQQKLQQYLKEKTAMEPNTSDSITQQVEKRTRKTSNKPIGSMVNSIRKFIRENKEDLESAVLTGEILSLTQTNTSYMSQSALETLRRELKTHKKYRDLVVSNYDGKLCIRRYDSVSANETPIFKIEKKTLSI
jgi:hypothetical protein